MTHLLHIDSSARTTGSITRHLTAEFTMQWKSSHPDGRVTYRDLATAPIPHLAEATVAAMFLPPAARTASQIEATALQEELIAELAASDIVVIGAPMYNFSIPSVLKAWIDHVVIFGRTVGQGVFGSTRVVIATGRGGAYGPGTPRAPFDYQEPYLRAIFGLIGLTDVTFVHAEMRAAAEGDPALAPFMQFAADSLAVAHAALRETAGSPVKIPATLAGVAG